MSHEPAGNHKRYKARINLQVKRSPISTGGIGYRILQVQNVTFADISSEILYAWWSNTVELGLKKPKERITQWVSGKPEARKGASWASRA